MATAPLEKLRTSGLESFYATLRTRGGRCGHSPTQDHASQLCEKGGPLSAASVRRIHVVIHAALEQAVTWEWIAANPASRASPGKVEQAEVIPPAVPEVLALLDAAERDNPALAVFLILAALTGARRGELCALRWTDLDTDAGTVTFSRVISMGPTAWWSARSPRPVRRCAPSPSTPRPWPCLAPITNAVRSRR
ncbi:MAG TPA: site-specific integrase [Acidimicrobiales bacterium]|nr:site-specific integrase [Acidimicrobiales bacterium]